MTNKHSILIVDDHLMIIDGYKTALKFGFSNFSDAKLNVDYATNFKDAIEKIKQTNKDTFYDLVVLDLSIPKCSISNMNTGEDLGKWIRLTSPKTKLLVLTAYDDAFRINSVLNSLKPEGFLLKGEISSLDFITAVIKLLQNKVYYGNKITKLLNNKSNQSYKIDKVDIQILNEMSNGTKNIDLPKYIPMSKSGIEKRKRQLKRYFKVKDDCNRELILIAKEKGYI